MTAADDSMLLRSSLLAAFLNALVAICLRGITFAINAFILRHISHDVLGIINVRLLLLVDTIIFISREAFRKACLKTPKEGEWRGTINLVWLSVPLGVLSSVALGYMWAYHLELPEGLSLQHQYKQAVALVCLSAVIELSCEPFFVVGQIFMWVKFRSAVDIIGLGIRSALLALAVRLHPEKTVMLFGCAHLLSSVVQLSAYIIAFCQSFRTDAKPLAPLKSLRDILPTSSDLRVDEERWALASSFFRQGLIKQLLTEGEKYIFTWFSLMTLAQQGIYDVIANLGSLAARLVFSKVEEAAYLYFNQSIVTRGGENVSPQVLSNLRVVLRAMTLLGLLVMTFGFSYSHLLLHLYGGTNLSTGLGPELLRGHCVFVLLMAVNGVSECFSFAIMTSAQVDSYNYLMSGMTIVFFFCAWVFASIFGPIGFIMANMANFAMRICHSCITILKCKPDNGINPLTGLVPPFQSILALAVSGAVCHYSELTLYDPYDYRAIFVHLAIGAFSFICTLIIMLVNESEIVSLAKSRLKRD